MAGPKINIKQNAIATAAALRVEVEPHDIEVTGDTARVTDPQLVRALVKAPAEALQLLGGIAPVDLDDIDVDKSGRLVIKNAKFAKALRTRVSKMAAADNGICGFKCGIEGIGPGDIAVNPAINNPIG
jgi:hypothetical protein